MKETFEVEYVGRTVVVRKVSGIAGPDAKPDPGLTLAAGSAREVANTLKDHFIATMTKAEA